MNDTFRNALSEIGVDNEETSITIFEEIFTEELPISVIKEKVTQEAFNVFIGVLLIGCWKGDGWAVGIFGNTPEVVPYASEVLNNIGLNEIADKVSETISIFPEWTDFSEDTQDYCDIINFLEGRVRLVEDKPKFKKLSDSEKLLIPKNYENAIETLDNITEKIWGYNAPNMRGWGILNDYIKNNLDAKIWK